MENVEDTQGLTGNLKVIPIADLLNLLASTKKTGHININARDLKLKIYFSNGEITFIESPTMNKIVADYLREKEIIEDEHWAEIISIQDDLYNFSGFQLFQKGFIDALSLAEAIRVGVIEILAILFGQEEGNFHFHKTSEPFVFPITLSLPVPYLLLNAARIADEKQYYKKDANLIVKAGVRKGKLVFICNEKIIHTHTLKTGTSSIGSSPGADINIGREYGFSPMQVRITLTGQNFYLDDLEGLNRVSVKGTPISRYKLKDGDEIEVGKVRILFHIFNPTNSKV